MKQILRVSLFVMAGVANTAWACGIEGTATWPSGSKWDGSGKISTSWNFETVYPKSGRYELALGSGACGSKVTVYANGKEQTELRLPKSGNARLDLVYDEHGKR